MSNSIPGLQGLDLNTIINVLTYGFFFVAMFYGQKIQFYLTLNGLKRSINRLKLMRDEAAQKTMEYFVGTGKAPANVESRMNQILDYITIMPVSLDPKGLVGKLEYVVRTGEDRVRSEVRLLLKDASSVQVSVAQSMIEIASELNTLHKVARHYYLTGKKTNSYMTLVQLQMSLPQMLQEADALTRAAESFRLSQPIGDGAGPMAASRLMMDFPKQKIADDTVIGVREYKGRTLYVLKAEGPMSYVGRPDDGLQRLVEEMHVPIHAIIMVDAALKLEGEKTGEVAEGVGAAIGGIGAEKFRIEEVAQKYNIPIYAVLVKQSEVQAITTMRKEIAEASEKVLRVIDRLIEGATKEGETVLVAGIGNTLGIGQ